MIKKRKTKKKKKTIEGPNFVFMLLNIRAPCHTCYKDTEKKTTHDKSMSI